MQHNQATLSDQAMLEGIAQNCVLTVIGAKRKQVVSDDLAINLVTLAVCLNTDGLELLIDSFYLVYLI